MLAANLMHFVRVLRACGLPLGPAKVLDALAATQAVGIRRRDDFAAALSTVLVSRREHLPIFEQAFEVFWRNPRLLEKMMAALLPRVHGLAVPDAVDALPARIAQALLPRREAPGIAEDTETELDAAFTFSAREILQRKDFATMTSAELEDVKAMLARLRLPLPEVGTRRMSPAHRGRQVDLRRTMRKMTGAAGRAALLAWKRPRKRTPPLVVLCDISGSMDRYARMLLYFLHAITNDQDRVDVLLFGTRLTPVTRYLRHRDVDVALARVATAVEDWSGGTRIGACLAEFNRRWARRLLAQNAVVLLITDGLDAEGGSGLAAEAERLAKSCRRLVWLNPLLRYEGFEARPAGIRALLPWVDDFLPVHNLLSLRELADALGRGSTRGTKRSTATSRPRTARPRAPGSR